MPAMADAMSTFVLADRVARSLSPFFRRAVCASFGE